MTDQYAVFGNPVSHSLSPWIHARFAEQTGQALHYGKQEVPLEGFAQAVRQFFADGGLGLNVTVPFKQQAWALCASRSRRAESAGAVNTLLMRDNGLFGDNTDGAGLVRDLQQNLGLELAGRRLLMLGAGGAARGVLLPLLDASPADLTIANRTPDKAVALAREASSSGPATACTFAGLAGRRFDLVINATSAGLSGGMPTLPDGLFTAEGAAYDMVYGPRPTRFMEWARKQGVTRVHDGLGMLVEQAAESFLLWRGVRPDTGCLLDELREHLGQ
ncbi:MAG: shikimate dehydrogenase [Ectothiorhodospiraceae bacterium]|nr:shikimate dehydrogenase [Ectothiorhodospiraceae bacterium]